VNRGVITGVGRQVGSLAYQLLGFCADMLDTIVRLLPCQIGVGKESDVYEVVNAEGQVR
jgi:RIO-like serine/threonine protein kinase